MLFHNLFFCDSSDENLCEMSGTPHCFFLVQRYGFLLVFNHVGDLSNLLILGIFENKIAVEVGRVGQDLRVRPVGLKSRFLDFEKFY